MNIPTNKPARSYTDNALTGGLKLRGNCVRLKQTRDDARTWKRMYRELNIRYHEVVYGKKLTYDDDDEYEDDEDLERNRRLRKQMEKARRKIKGEPKTYESQEDFERALKNDPELKLFLGD